MSKWQRLQCDKVRGWIETGSFDLKELEKHVETCKVCRHLLCEAKQVVKEEFETWSGEIPTQEN